MSDSEDNQQDHILNEDMTFKTVTVDLKYQKVQQKIVEFITSVILKQEKKLYNVAQQHFPNQIESILGLTSKAVFELIRVTTMEFYNKLYFDIQNKCHNPITDFILEISQEMDYGPHVLLDKLVRLTLDTHLEIARETLVLDHIDAYEQSVLTEVNLYLPTLNILHILAKGIDDEIPFKEVPSTEKPFDIDISYKRKHDKPSISDTI